MRVRTARSQRLCPVQVETAGDVVGAGPDLVGVLLVQVQTRPVPGDLGRNNRGIRGRVVRVAVPVGGAAALDIERDTGQAKVIHQVLLVAHADILRV